MLILTNCRSMCGRSIYMNVVGNCKTEASRKPVPMDLILASALWSWKQDSPYGHADDWVFASPHTRGRNPYWPDSLLSHIIRPAAVCAGIRKHIAGTRSGTASPPC